MTSQHWRVAIFEDQGTTVETYKQTLAADGRFTYMISRTPKLDDEARQELFRFRPDLIIIDLVLGERRDSGLYLIEVIRAMQGLDKKPVLVISNILGPGSDFLEPLRQIPGVHLLPKTVPFSVPVDEIARILEGGKENAFS